MKINELTDEAKQHAIDKHRFMNVEGVDWYDSAIDSIVDCGKLIGIDFDNSKVYFSGFGSQGDGACFEGDYQYRKQSVSLTFGNTPKDEELISIAKNLQELQRKYFYQLYAKVSHSHNYYHSNSVTIEVSGNDDFMLSVPDEAQEGIEEFLRDFMNWSYRLLEKEYEYLLTDEQVGETLEINEYEFNSDGDDL